jgi:prepilin-type N-terminal cleavage/methylation domain-containing protein
MAINEGRRPADSASVTRILSRALGPRATTDDGFSMVEMMVSLLIIAIVSVASIAFFVDNIRGVNNQRQHQEAVYLADQQIQSVESLPVANLVTGRTQAEVTAAFSSAAATKLNIAAQDDTSSAGDYDVTATSTGNETVPVTSTQTVNKVPYSLTTFIDVCWYNNTTGFCTPTAGATSTQEYRVSVYVSWSSAGICSNTCNYTSSTIIDPSTDPLFNTNISQPTATLTTPASGTAPNDNDANSCTTNGTTYPGTLFSFTAGANLKSNIRVLISTGGGTIPAASIYQPTAAEVDFCLQTYDRPGIYTLSVINTDGGHFQTSITEVPALTGAGSYTPTGKSLTLSGGGFESGATFSATGASWSGTSSLVTGKSINNGDANDDSVVLTNFVGPTNGGTATITMTNTDLSSATWTITAPKAVTQSRSAIVSGQTLNVTVTGSGFQSGFTPVVTNATLTATYVSSTTVTLTMTGMVAGTPATVVLYNPDGGATATMSFNVDPPPVVVSATPNKVVATQPITVTVAGTGFVTGMTVAQTNGTSLTVVSLSSTSLVLSVTAATVGTDAITLTNPDGGTTSFSLTVDAPPAIASITPNPVLVSSTHTMTLTGTGFQSGLSVSAARGTFTLGTVTATSITLTSFTVPTTGADVITVTNPDGGVSTYSINVTPPPTLTSITGAPVVKSQAETITLVGTGFQSGLTVSASNGTWTVGTITATSIVLNNFSATSVGTDTITVTNPDGGSASIGLTVDAAPTITAVTPATVKHNTVTTYTLTGTGFVTGATVTITEGGTSMTSISATTVSSSTSLSFSAKARATPTSGSTTVVITVTNPDGGVSNAFSKSMTAS